MTVLKRIKENISRVIIGKEDVVDLIFVGLIANGHILIEDVPGLGKTLLAKTLAVSMDCNFKRIQFTPDLTPTDVTGFYIFDRQTNDFVFREGPIFTNILLADEINRAVPRTQSSLLEAMEERQVTIDGKLKLLPKPFIVFATQNPVEMDGTFQLPEAQLDRFLLKVKMGYPSYEEEMNILLNHGKENPLTSLKSVTKIEDILHLQKLREQVKVHSSILQYIVSLIRATRSHSAFELGASPRASLALFKAAQALALIKNRDYVIPDDVKFLVPPVLAHRIVLKREESLKGIEVETVLQEILDSINVPIKDEGKDNRA